MIPEGIKLFQKENNLPNGIRLFLKAWNHSILTQLWNNKNKKVQRCRSPSLKKNRITIFHYCCYILVIFRNVVDETVKEFPVQMITFLTSFTKLLMSQTNLKHTAAKRTFCSNFKYSFFKISIFIDFGFLARKIQIKKKMIFVEQKIDLCHSVVPIS